MLLFGVHDIDIQHELVARSIQVIFIESAHIRIEIVWIDCIMIMGRCAFTNTYNTIGFGIHPPMT
jgi:hypothetical protein